ncbi:hypothetical protein SAMN05661107_2215 [Maritimibacter sp. HL-12]|nr:hypothetical protein SAMN05661107_2215 [Maritimibacter sp. HL-12]
MKRMSHRFARREDGSVTIDWVVLLAGLVLLAISVVGILASDVIDLGTTVSDQVESMADHSPG